MKKIVITVSGPPGSGKSTHAKRIAEKLNLRYFSIGRYFRDIANKMNLSLEEFQRIAEKDPKYDLEADNRTLMEAEKGGVVIDGHLTGWIAKEKADIKIYLTASLEERARRVAKRDGKPFEQAINDIRRREESNALRYKTFYGIDLNDLSIYDIVINTEKWEEEEVSQTLIYLIQKYMEKRNTFN
ncbi:MAG: AAA family ATPase [archaeon YNP-LCB-003-016]|uniref:(d)CMP kinase n=1 Tax=Candidatus Culexarchaeum yellowstonense TaxID=2928963 RepID=UPI0026F0F7B8|nr:AAA family ATPase [Candidatus Culexarchaeum yellowstonense]MCR6691245.1 AAA family ATPase [Candidatus Culexarchaeum yellowstonense]